MWWVTRWGTWNVVLSKFAGHVGAQGGVGVRVLCVLVGYQQVYCYTHAVIPFSSRAPFWQCSRPHAVKRDTDTSRALNVTLGVVDDGRERDGLPIQ